MGRQGSGSAPLRQAPGIRILVLEGATKVNRLTEGIFAMPVVEIRDGNDRPVEGAQVTFILNGGTGPGASFRDGSLEKVFASNAQGQAAAEGYVPNPVEGKFNVRVRAKYLEDTTEIVIQQASSFQTQMAADQKKRGAWKKWLWIGGAVAAGVITAVLIFGGSGSSEPPVIVVTPGPPVIGGR